jgi:hypothetical protein
MNNRRFRRRAAAMPARRSTTMSKVRTVTLAVAAVEKLAWAEAAGQPTKQLVGEAKAALRDALNAVEADYPESYGGK